MLENIIAAIIGVVVIVLGAFTMAGRTNLLHSYHIKRVAEKDLPTVGKFAGLGTVICGVGVLLKSVFSIVFLLTEAAVFETLGTIFLIAGLAIGIALALATIIKYNKGLF